MIRRFHLRTYWSRSWDIARRYFVVNGFDGALTMLGLTTGFQLGAGVELDSAISACVGAAVALGVSGATSAYLSESAERRRSLADLEDAMVADLSGSDRVSEARVVPFLVALVNGGAPLLLSLIIITPLWLARAGVELPVDPLPAAIGTAFLCIFGLGVFLGRVGDVSWLWSGVKTIAIAGVTFLLILALERW